MPATRPLPSISVITPCLNAAGTLAQTLASVRDQDYAARVQHIVVDGGSTDGTVAILERADGVRFISEPDRGLSHAMNKGVAMASCDLVGWLNADDWYEPGAFAAVGRASTENPNAPWITGYCRIVDGAGAEIRKPITAYKNFLLRHYSLGVYLTQNFISTPATFIRRDALWSDPYDERFKTSMDYDVHLQIARRGDPVILRQVLSNFRMVEGTLSMSGFERQFEEHVENARTHGDGHRVAVAMNRLISRGIVATYRALRVARRS